MRVRKTQLTLPTMVLQHTNLAVQILFFGSLLSAIMSTTSSAILAPAAIFSENLVRPLMGGLNDRQMLWLTRGSVLVFSALATVMACMRSNIYELVGESSVLSMVTLLAPLAFGIYWKRTTSLGSMASMITGFIAWIIFEFVVDIGIHSLVPATLVSIVALVAVSLFTRQESPHSP